MKLEKPGLLSINIKQYMRFLKMELLDANGDKVTTAQYTEYDTDVPTAWGPDIHLEAGIYYIRIMDSISTGKYQLTANFNPANNNDQEPNNQKDNAQILLLNKKPLIGFISTQDNQDFYKVTLSNAGLLSISIKQKMRYLKMELLDSEGNKIAYLSNTEYDTNVPNTWGPDVHLEPGPYYIRILESGYTGTYQLNANFTPANNQDREPNNKKEEAQVLKLNTKPLTGLISEQDDQDFYKVTLSKSGMLSINIKQHMRYLSMELLDRDGNKIESNNHTEYDTNAPEFWGTERDLKAGTYYIRILKNNSYTGTYQLSAKAPAEIPSAPQANQVSNKSKVVTGKTMANSTVKIRIDKKTYTGKSNKTGSYRVTIPAQTAGTTISITAINSDGVTSKTRTLKVVDKIPPKTPTVGTITQNTTSIKGKTEAYATVYVYKGQTKIGSAKADKKGNYIIKIKKQKSKTKLSIYAKDRSGNKSASVNKIVK